MSCNDSSYIMSYVYTLRNFVLAAATAQTRPSNGVLVAGLGGYQMGGRPIVLRQLLCGGD